MEIKMKVKFGCDKKKSKYGWRKWGRDHLNKVGASGPFQFGSLAMLVWSHLAFFYKSIKIFRLLTWRKNDWNVIIRNNTDSRHSGVKMTVLLFLCQWDGPKDYVSTTNVSLIQIQYGWKLTIGNLNLSLAVYDKSFGGISIKQWCHYSIVSTLSNTGRLLLEARHDKSWTEDNSTLYMLHDLINNAHFKFLKSIESCFLISADCYVSVRLYIYKHHFGTSWYQQHYANW